MLKGHAYDEASKCLAKVLVEIDKAIVVDYFGF